MKRIVISYLGDVAAGAAGEIFQALQREFGVDSDSIVLSPPDDAHATLLNTAVVVLVIGAQSPVCGEASGEKKLEHQLSSSEMLLPVLLDGAKLPLKGSLPIALQGLYNRHPLVFRREHRAHDTRLLLAQLDALTSLFPQGTRRDLAAYPKHREQAATPLSDAAVLRLLEVELPGWQLEVSARSEAPGKVRAELVREFQFRCFQDAVGFMSRVAPGCDIAMHHPRWENVWKRLKVALTTWDQDLLRITGRDALLAKYFNREFDEYLAECPPKSD